MVKFDSNKLKKIPKKCILEEDKVCDNCCDCFVCDLDPAKSCDNCAKCLELADFNAIEISEILLYNEKIFEYGKNDKKKATRPTAQQKAEKAENREK